MKQIAKAVLKVVVVIVLFTGGSVILTSSGSNIVCEAKAATNNQVYEYLLSKGYAVESLCPKAGTKFDWTAITIKNNVSYTTTIYCTETSVVGNSDVPM